jgi:hypothetical protein
MGHFVRQLEAGESIMETIRDKFGIALRDSLSTMSIKM